METIINDLQEANRKFQIATKELSDAKAEANKTSGENRILKTKLESQRNDLKSRENVVGNTEQLLSRVEEARKLKSDNIKIANSLEKQQSDLNLAKNEFAKELSVNRQENSHKTAENTRLSDELRTTRDEYKQKIKDVKNTVLEELGRKIK